MKIRYDLSDEFYTKGFTPETDPFQRADLAERLPRLYKGLDQSTVSILDARWGSGKSVFARQWKHHLESNGVPAIYFDAFATDYVEDPFQAVTSAFVRASMEARSHDEDAYERFLGSASKVIKAIAAPAAKIGAKAITFGLIGTAEIDQLNKAAEHLADGFGELSELSVKSMLERQAGDEANFRALRSSLATLPALLGKRLYSGRPEFSTDDLENISLVVIIDELD